MKYRHWIACFLTISTLLAATPPAPDRARADAADAWWDDAWPYRVPVTASGSGVAEATIDFTVAFATLGLDGALLDARSLRVVAYDGNTPGAPVAYAETYSTMLEDADSPQTEWSSSGVYWSVNDGSASADGTRFSQGSGSLKAVVDNEVDGYGYPGVELHIASGEPLPCVKRTPSASALPSSLLMPQ